MLTQVGIRATLRSSPTNQFFPKLSQAHARASSNSAGRPTPDAWASLNALFRTCDKAGLGTFNAGRYSNPKLDALIDAMRIEPDLTRRRAMVAVALRLVGDDLPYVPLYPAHRQLGDEEEGAGRAMAERHDRAALGASSIAAMAPRRAIPLDSLPPTQELPMSITRFSFPTTIHFGPGARTLAGPHLRELRLSRPLDRHRQGPGGAAAASRALQASSQAGGLAVAVFGGVFGNPTGSQVMAGAAAYKAHRRRLRDRRGRRRGARRGQGRRPDGHPPRRRDGVRVGPPAGAADLRRPCRISSRCPPPRAPAAKSAAAA